MPQCRVGDLAIVIGDELGDAGLLVTVIKADDNPWAYEYLWEGPTWWVRCSVPLTWLSGDQGELQSHEGPMPDSVLFPIRGDRRVSVADAEEVVADAT